MESRAPSRGEKKDSLKWKGNEGQWAPQDGSFGDRRHLNYANKAQTSDELTKTMPSEGWKLTVGPKPGCTSGSFLEIRKPLGGYCTAYLRLQALAIGWDESCLLGAFGARLTAKGC